MLRFVLLAFVSLYLILAAPLHATEGVVVPEPSDLALFILGVLGLILGREAAVRYRRYERDRNEKP